MSLWSPGKCSVPPNPTLHRRATGITLFSSGDSSRPWLSVSFNRSAADRHQTAMKLNLLLPLALLFAPLVSFGDVVYEQTAEIYGEKHVSTFMFKGDRARLDFASPNRKMTTFIDRAGNAIAYEHNSKIVARTSMAKARAAAPDRLENFDGNSAKANAGKPTGETEKIGDWNCEIWTRETPLGTEKQWRTKEIPNLNRIREYMEKFASTSGLLGNFPTEGIAIKVETTGPKGKTTITTVKLAEEPVPDSAFVEPVGYREVQIPLKGSAE
jgi:hypothetical protein